MRNVLLIITYQIVLVCLDIQEIHSATVISFLKVTLLTVTNKCMPKIPVTILCLNWTSENRQDNACWYYFIIADTEPVNPCSPSPCGANAICQEGACSCIPEYYGDPYFGCKPECVLNSDCSRDKACIKNKCGDPCIGTCGSDAICEVFNHIPMCSCAIGYTGSPFHYCTKLQGIFKIVDA